MTKRYNEETIRGPLHPTYQSTEEEDEENWDGSPKEESHYIIFCVAHSRTQTTSKNNSTIPLKIENNLRNLSQ